MTELRDYKFKLNVWPPPSDRKGKDAYLFGFDDDMQPYVVRWEEQKHEEGWVATTLSEYKARGATAIPTDYKFGEVGKVLNYWADAPALMRSVLKVKAENKRRKECEDD